MATPMTADAVYQRDFTIAHEHPSLPGHFPGNPVVPGVVVLGEVLAAAERLTGARIGALRLPQVKFVQPLLPGQPARIEMERSGGRLRFRVLRDGQLIASGDIGTPA